MHDYSWLKNRDTPPPSDEAKAAFADMRADLAERNAAEWDGREDRMATAYAERFRAEAASLRAHAASLRGEA